MRGEGTRREWGTSTQGGWGQDGDNDNDNNDEGDGDGDEDGAGDFFVSFE